MGGQKALGLLALALTLTSVGARAQTVVRATGPDAATWQAELQARGAVIALPPPLDAPSTPRARLRALVEVERLLAEARAHAGRLDEGPALAALERARRLAEEHADVPGASRWLAEVELASGLVAAQAGQNALAEQGFRRAASLDPDRVVRAAEAAPAVANRAQELARAVATAPESLVVIEADVPGAVVELAGRELGRAPVELRAPAGRHVLRVVAPGHRAWGRALDLFEGRRAPMRVHLSPTEEERARRAFEAASTFDDARATRPPGVELFFVEARGDRALILRCDDAGCAPPVRLAPGEDWPTRWPEAAPDDPRELASARVWLRTETLPDRPPPPPPGRPWYRRWPVWTAVAAGVIAGAVGIGVALRPEPEQQLRVRIEPGDLGGM